jgi:hydroxyethylthiazole kinase
MMSHRVDGVARAVADGLTRVRERRPLVHHLANFVTMHLVAAATRALGALPVMAMSVGDAEAAAEQADAIVLSLGTPTDDRIHGMLAAGRRAADRKIPIVLDPVGAGGTPVRTMLAERVLRELPITVVRANRGEGAALAGLKGRVRGVEAESDGRGAGTDALAVAVALARTRKCIAAITGPVDHIAGEAGAVAVSNGHPWLEAMTGAGCIATAVVGAYCAVLDDHFAATAAALACFGAAAEAAARASSGPGTLAPALLDALYHLTPDDARRAARVTNA